jgi:hypothetical protein
MLDNYKIGKWILVMFASINIYIHVIDRFYLQFLPGNKVSYMKNLSKEEINSLKPEFKVKLLRYIEKKDNDSLEYLKIKLTNLETMKKI